MAGLEIDILVLVPTIILGWIIGPAILVRSIWKATRSREWWLRLRKQNWVYCGIKMLTAELKLVAVNMKDVGSDGIVRLFGKRRVYFIEDQNDEGLPTVVKNFRYGKPLYLYHYNDSRPLAWAPNPHLTSRYYPDALNDRVEARTLRTLAKAHQFMQWMWISVVLSVLAIIIIGGLAFMILGMQGDIGKLSHALTGNATSTGPPTPPTVTR